MISGVVLFFLARGVALVAVGAAASWDVAKRIVPNELVAVTAAAGLTARLVEAPLGEVALSAAAGAGLFLVLRLAMRFGYLGGGDVKLAGAVALGYPAQNTLTFVIVTSLAGGLIALCCLARGWSRRRRGETNSDREMPYAPAILAGVLWLDSWEVSQCFFGAS